MIVFLGTYDVELIKKITLLVMIHEYQSFGAGTPYHRGDIYSFHIVGHNVIYVFAYLRSCDY